MNRRGKKSKILVLALAALVMGVCATHAVAALAAGKPTAKQAEVLRLLREDGSLGAHNPEKAAKLLGLSK